MATGGRSLPKSGSDGFGLDCAQRLGHTIVATTPALVPLLLAGERDAHLSGVSHDAELTIWIDNRVHLRLRGSMLWTHVGISGPVVLDASRHWLRGELESRAVRMTASVIPGATFDTQDAWWTGISRTRPQASIVTLLATMVPASLATAMLSSLGLEPARTLAHLSRDDRRRLVRAITEWPLDISGSRGYTFAEATAGGVSLDEIDPSTMESRICPGLYLIGEMLDVDGRIGGFNFQWAWSSAYVAARALSLG
jgi:predicted Rossmann fold flavoprotein